MHALHHRVKDAADFQQAQHLLYEHGQVFGVGEATVNVGNDLEFSKLLARVVPQTLAGEIPYTVIAEARGPLLPLIRPTVLYGHCDCAHLAAGPRALFTRRPVVFGCVVVQYSLPGARSDIQASVRAAQSAERVAEAGAQKFQVVREPSTGDVTAGNIGGAAAVDFFLRCDFLIVAGLSGVLWRGSAQCKRLKDDYDENGQARSRGLRFFHGPFDCHNSYFLLALKKMPFLKASSKLFQA